MIETLWRGNQQLDFHLLPVIVKGGDESLVLVEKATLTSSNTIGSHLRSSSFLGVVPGDEVEMAVDVVDTRNNRVLYARSLHKEARGIYDAWDYLAGLGEQVANLSVTFTCRVNGPNREGKPEALFEGLYRLDLAP